MLACFGKAQYCYTTVQYSTVVPASLGFRNPRSYLINSRKRLRSIGIASSALQKGLYSLAFRKGPPSAILPGVSFHAFMR